MQAGATPDEVLATYQADIDRISAERGFTTVDVISIAPDNRRRTNCAPFLDEHFHKEDEVGFRRRLGPFTLHVGDKVYEIECVKDDLTRPDGTAHWFDMGPEPRFVAIRFFEQPDGWIGHHRHRSPGSSRATRIHCRLI